MGNQGMTNWKFSAFFAIALILVAGVFSSTAIALDGDGTITVGWAADTNGGNNVAEDKTVPQTAPDAATAATDPLASGSVENEVILRYSANNIDMSGGSFRVLIPSGFTVSKGLVTVTDSVTGTTTGTAAGAVLYDTARDGKVDNDPAPGNLPQDDDHADRRGRVKILPVSGTTVSSIEVTLDADWDAEHDGVLTIQFSLVTAAVPSSLPFTSDNDTEDDLTDDRRYQEYRFTTSSKKKDGTLTRLKATSGVPEPQPYVWVGNAAAGTGTATVTPTAAFEGESDVDFRIVYTAAGTMYNSKIRVTIPASLLMPDPDANVAPNQQEIFEDAITISQRGGVNFGDANGEASGSPVYVGVVENGTIDISIDNLNKGDQVRIFYENITVQALAAGANEMITVGTDTNEDETDAFTQVGDPIGSVKPKLGSGEITLNPAAVEVNAIRDYTITYKALTKLENVYLVVQLPTGAFVDGADGAVESFTTDRVNNDGVLNHAYIPTVDGQTFTTDNDAVVWKIASIAKNGTFRKTIKRLRATGDAGAYPWTVHLLLEDPLTSTPTGTDDQVTTGNTLYVLQAGSDPDNPDVTFGISTPIPSDSVRGEGYPAASEQIIAFTFVPGRTPIKDGNVSFRIPSGWTAPTKTDGAAGEVTVAATILTGDMAVEDKHLSTSGMEVTVSIVALSRSTNDGATSVVVTYTKGIVQHNAQEEVEIRGYFKSGASLPERVSEIVMVGRYQRCSRFRYGDHRSDLRRGGQHGQRYDRPVHRTRFDGRRSGAS